MPSLSRMVSERCHNSIVAALRKFRRVHERSCCVTFQARPRTSLQQLYPCRVQKNKQNKNNKNTERKEKKKKQKNTTTTKNLKSKPGAVLQRLKSNFVATKRSHAFCCVQLFSELCNQEKGRLDNVTPRVANLHLQNSNKTTQNQDY